MIAINNSRESSNCYLNALIESVYEKREMSLQEFNKTNLIDGSDIELLSTWYEQLIQLVLKNPPESYVKKIVVYQNQIKILSIQYIYSESNRPSDSVLISIDNL